MEWLTAMIFLRSLTLKWFNSLETLSVNLILRVIDAIKPIHKSGENWILATIKYQEIGVIQKIFTAIIRDM